MCCFKLSISDSEYVKGTYTDTSGTGANPAGEYEYHLRGVAYGLAVLEGGSGDLESIYGGVAAGDAEETNHVMFDGNASFGCPETPHNTRKAGTLEFRRAEHDAPWYEPPQGGGGVFDFGGPFDTWAPKCSNFGDAENMVERVTGGECGEPELLQTPGDGVGGPICNPANPAKALRKGEHEARITCTERADWSNASYAGEAEVAIVINIEHVSPDDREHQEKTLRGFIDRDYYPGHSPADGAVTKLFESPPSKPFQCSLSS